MPSSRIARQAIKTLMFISKVNRNLFKYCFQKYWENPKKRLLYNRFGSITKIVELEIIKLFVINLRFVWEGLKINALVCWENEMLEILYYKIKQGNDSVRTISLVILCLAVSIKFNKLSSKQNLIFFKKNPQSILRTHVNKFYQIIFRIHKSIQIINTSNLFKVEIQKAFLIFFNVQSSLVILKHVLSTMNSDMFIKLFFIKKKRFILLKKFFQLQGLFVLVKEFKFLREKGNIILWKDNKWKFGIPMTGKMLVLLNYVRSKSWTKMEILNRGNLKHYNLLPYLEIIPTFFCNFNHFSSKIFKFLIITCIHLSNFQYVLLKFSSFFLYLLRVSIDLPNTDPLQNFLFLVFENMEEILNTICANFDYIILDEWSEYFCSSLVGYVFLIKSSNNLTRLMKLLKQLLKINNKLFLITLVKKISLINDLSCQAILLTSIIFGIKLYIDIPFYYLLVFDLLGYCENNYYVSQCLANMTNYLNNEHLENAIDQILLIKTNTILTWNWIFRSRLIRFSKLFLETLKCIINVLTYSNENIVNKMVQYIYIILDQNILLEFSFSRSELVCNERFHHLVYPFLLKKLELKFNTSKNRIIILRRIIASLPANIFYKHIEKIFPLIIQFSVISVNFIEKSTLFFLFRVFQRKPRLLEPYVYLILPILNRILVDKQIVELKLSALEYLSSLTKLKFYIIFKYKKMILNILKKVLDDPKRIVRQEVVKCLEVWNLV